MSGEQQLHICNQPLLGQGHCRTNTLLCGSSQAADSPPGQGLIRYGETMIEVDIIDAPLAGSGPQLAPPGGRISRQGVLTHFE